jgi:hypothetical protein
MHPSVSTDQNDGLSEALHETTETAATQGDRDVLLINGNAFHVS